MKYFSGAAMLPKQVRLQDQTRAFAQIVTAGVGGRWRNFSSGLRLVTALTAGTVRNGRACRWPIQRRDTLAARVQRLRQ
jgi:ABC-type taurine transport system substrate-binding protein